MYLSLNNNLPFPQVTPLEGLVFVDAHLGYSQEQVSCIMGHFCSPNTIFRICVISEHINHYSEMMKCTYFRQFSSNNTWPSAYLPFGNQHFLFLDVFNARKNQKLLICCLLIIFCMFLFPIQEHISSLLVIQPHFVFLNIFVFRS